MPMQDSIRPVVQRKLVPDPLFLWGGGLDPRGISTTAALVDATMYLAPLMVRERAELRGYALDVRTIVVVKAFPSLRFGIYEGNRAGGLAAPDKYRLLRGWEVGPHPATQLYYPLNEPQRTRVLHPGYYLLAMVVTLAGAAVTAATPASSLRSGRLALGAHAATAALPAEIDLGAVVAAPGFGLYSPAVDWS